MPKFWKRLNNFWAADFKCALNTQQDSNLPEATGINALLDGDLLNGKWVEVSFKDVDTDINKYCEITGIMSFNEAKPKSGS